MMKTVQISLNSIDKVKSFVNEITKYDNDFDLVSGRYVIDAKSIMGIFSLDLSKPIENWRTFWLPWTRTLSNNLVSRHNLRTDFCTPRLSHIRGSLFSI